MKSAESNLVELNSADHHLSVSIISIKLCWSKVNWTYSKKQTCDNHSAEGAKTNIMWQNNITTCITILYHLILWMYLILPKWFVVNLSIVVFYIDPGAIIHLWWSCFPDKQTGANPRDITLLHLLTHYLISSDQFCYLTFPCSSLFYQLLTVFDEIHIIFLISRRGRDPET